MGNSCFGKGRRQEPRRELVSGWDLRIAQWPLNPSRVGHLTDRWPLLRRTETNHKLSAPLSNFRRPCSIPDSLLFEGIPNSPSQENLIHSTKSEMVSGGKAAHLSSPCTLDSHRLQGPALCPGNASRDTRSGWSPRCRRNAHSCGKWKRLL